MSQRKRNPIVEGFRRPDSNLLALHSKETNKNTNRVFCDRNARYIGMMTSYRISLSLAPSTAIMISAEFDLLNTTPSPSKEKDSPHIAAINFFLMQCEIPWGQTSEGAPALYQHWLLAYPL